MVDYIVVGSGFTGAVIAERLANIENKKVLIIEQRNHIAGNMYDFIDENQILCHKYGPHFLFTSKFKVWEYINTFGEWLDFEPDILTFLNEVYVKMPFDLNLVDVFFGKVDAEYIKYKIIEEFNANEKINIFDLMKSDNLKIKEFASLMYQNNYEPYSMKQWGVSPYVLEKKVVGRTPIWISNNGRKSADYKFKKIPKDGYLSIFTKMLSNKNIEVILDTDAKELLKLDFDNGDILFYDKPFNGKVIYTGCIDELFEHKFGKLPYRSLEFIHESIAVDFFQTGFAVYHPELSVPFTRVTEYKYMMQDAPKEITSIVKEIPVEYNKGASVGNIPYYPFITTENLVTYQKYANFAKKIKNLYLLGRLAEYKYYNMDEAIENALNFFENTIKDKA